MNFTFAVFFNRDFYSARRGRVAYAATPLIAALAAAIPMLTAAQSPRSADLSPPVVAGRWLRPSETLPAEPRWGFAEGLQVGIHPLGGPRGLLRVYAPYLDHPRDRLINFIAVEPIAQGKKVRGLSELEPSQLDGVRGKRFWSADSPHDPAPQRSEHPARGLIETIDCVEQLCVYILVERFQNGAHVYLRLAFRADRPHEVGIAVCRHEGSQPLDYCIVTATMGNFARLRQLHLADRTVTSPELWPDFGGDDFTPHARFPLATLARNATGEAIVSATTDEAEPAVAPYSAGTHRHWKYYGRKAIQSWRAADPDDRLEALVNARRVYWASQSPIPGGVSFENFELVEPFLQGREFVFGIEIQPDAVTRSGETE